MGEVDQLQDTVDHGVAEGDEGINRPHREPIGELLKEYFHETFVARDRPTAPPGRGSTRGLLRLEDEFTLGVHLVYLVHLAYTVTLGIEGNLARQAGKVL
jgi:hypothetical protein